VSAFEQNRRHDHRGQQHRALAARFAGANADAAPDNTKSAYELLAVCAPGLLALADWPGCSACSMGWAGICLMLAVAGARCADPHGQCQRSLDNGIRGALLE